MKRIPCWSYKQVRTRFENLRREGLIEVSRSAKNGSLEYRIPEELAEQRSPFEHLPAVEEVERFI
ncbi:MAG: hypothetical protein DWQ35_13795 [Planctomycetota bacterium]|nr:MAG: hypothetical protein DWQ35_13795 [Planctomycetota bacterium]REK25985.1 MAG: hypothetical protein DWQ42_10165 [Planctomycetota bacterium]REK46900.1 MAG: hypothetical protein DWQ46_05240 [Planctomycetota bacterium]